MKLFDFIKKYRIILVIVLVVLAGSSYLVYGYTQNNPKFCTTCHLMNDAYETWDHSAMHDLNCHTCHETDIVESLDHVREVIFENPDEVTKLTVIDNEVCEECHASEDPQWIQVSKTVGHDVHVYLQEDEPECIFCHGIQLHVFEPPEETCYKCHEQSHEDATEEMGAHCIVCHEFAVIKEELIPDRQECIACHLNQQDMGVSFPTGAHNKTDCNNCHNPHIEEQHTDCIICHEEHVGAGLHTAPAHGDCLLCHVPHSSETMRNQCLSCHLDKIEHGGTTECSTCHRFKN